MEYITEIIIFITGLVVGLSFNLIFNNMKSKSGCQQPNVDNTNEPPKVKKKKFAGTLMHEKGETNIFK